MNDANQPSQYQKGAYAYQNNGHRNDAGGLYKGAGDDRKQKSQKIGMIDHMMIKYSRGHDLSFLLVDMPLLAGITKTAATIGLSCVPSDER